MLMDRPAVSQEVFTDLLKTIRQRAAVLSVHDWSELYSDCNVFPPNCSPEMRERQQFFFGGRLVSILFEELQDPAIKTKIVLHFGGIFIK